MSTKRTRSSSTKHQSLRSGSLSKPRKSLSVDQLEARTNALLRQQKQTEEQIAEIKARLAILRENVNRLMNPNPFWGH